MRIPVVCGNPDESTRGATFSRFVLPFGYRLETVAPKAGEPVYEPVLHDGEGWAERVAYFSHEIAWVLYGRARWFQVAPEVWGRQGFALGDTPGRRVTAIIRPPRVVLFECPDCDRAGKSPERDGGDSLQVGMLVVDLHFEEDGADFVDLLRVNELFRYHDRPFIGHEKAYTKLFGECFGGWFRSRCVDRSTPADLYAELWEQWLSFPIRHGERCWRLFPEAWKKAATDRRGNLHRLAQAGGKAASLAGGFHRMLESGPGWNVYADNRALVWTAAVLDGGFSALGRLCPEDPANPVANGCWTKLLNVDGAWTDDYDKLADQTAFENAWTRERTYTRWAHFGSVYGFCYHSGAAMLPPSDDPPLVRYFSGMYFDMVLLLFYVRVVLFRFSHQLAKVSATIREAGGEKARWRDKFQEIREDFTLFTNLYQFPLLSNQQQAIEMYDCARRAMDLDDLFEEVQEEINVSHECLMQDESHKLGVRATLLAVVGTVGMVVGTATGILGMSVLVSDVVKGCWPAPRAWGVAGVVSAGTLLLFWVTLRGARWFDGKLTQTMFGRKGKEETK